MKKFLWRHFEMEKNLWKYLKSYKSFTLNSRRTFICSRNFYRHSMRDLCTFFMILDEEFMKMRLKDYFLTSTTRYLVQYVKCGKMPKEIFKDNRWVIIASWMRWKITGTKCDNCFSTCGRPRNRHNFVTYRWSTIDTQHWILFKILTEKFQLDCLS